MRSINEKQGKTSTSVSVFAVLLLLILGAGVFGIYRQSVGGDGNESPTTCADSTGILTLTAVNALQKGTAVSSPTITAGVNGDSVTTTVTSGTTTFPVGAKVEVLVAKADYVDTSYSFTMPCGGKTAEVEMYASGSSNPSVRMKNDDGDFMTNGGGATNQTNLNAGETLTVDVELQGTNLESSGDLILIVETPASSGSNVTDILLPGATKLDYVPSVYSNSNAGSKTVAFKVPAIVGADKKSYALSLVLGSAKDLAGTVVSTWYSEQSFVDSDGKIKTGIQNADGTAKYENTGSYSFVVNSA